MNQAPGRPKRDPKTGEVYIEVQFTGEVLTNMHLFNKGTAFTERERDQLHLRGLIPPRVFTMEENPLKRPTPLCLHGCRIALAASDCRFLAASAHPRSLLSVARPSPRPPGSLH